MKPLIKLTNAGVTYDMGTTSETVALHDINIEIFPGEYIVFLGQSGSGKSTLLYTIAGLETPTHGEVIVGGNDLRNIEPKQKIEFYLSTIGMIFQAFYLVPHLTAKDNIILAKMFSGAPSEERIKKAEALMDRFGITPFADRKPAMMSGGQQQRTAIARALMNDPQIILADEPVGNLDSKNSQVVLELLADIHKKEKKTIIQVTHNANDAHYADRVFYVKDGVIERIVVNTHEDHPHETIKTGGVGTEGEIQKLESIYPSASETELKSMLIMRKILMPYSIETEHIIVKAIEKYINKELTVEGLVKELDSKTGGAGLYAQKAVHIANQVEHIFNEMQLVKAGADIPKEADAIISTLIETYRGSLNLDQINRLKIFISERISGKISRDQLKEKMDIAFSAGGVGLNVRTAKHFSDEIEIICLK